MIMDDATMVVEEVTMIVSGATMVVEEVTMIVDELTMIVGGATMIMEEATMIIEEATKVLDDIAMIAEVPATAQSHKTIVSYLKIININTMINQDQSREYNRGKKLQKFLNDNSSVYQDFEPFADEVDDFNTNVQAFDDLIPDKNNSGTGITTDKTTVKRTVADALALAERKTYSYALKYNNPQLAAEVNNTADKIFRMKDAALQGYAASITGIITPLLPDANYIKYGVTQQQLDAIKANAKTFNGLIGAANVTDSANTVANTAINKVIVKIRENIKHFDLLVDEFAEKNPEFVQGYHLNSEPDNIGVRHSGIEGYVRGGKDGGAISGATVKLQNTTKSAVTDLKGYYHIDRAEPNDYMVECSADGYTAQTKLHHISRGRTDEMDWELA